MRLLFVMDSCSCETGSRNGQGWIQQESDASNTRQIHLDSRLHWWRVSELAWFLRISNSCMDEVTPGKNDTVEACPWHFFHAI
jgi:hypothetical protein